MQILPIKTQNNVNNFKSKVDFYLTTAVKIRPDESMVICIPNCLKSLNSAYQKLAVKLI